MQTSTTNFCKIQHTPPTLSIQYTKIKSTQNQTNTNLQTQRSNLNKSITKLTFKQLTKPPKTQPKQPNKKANQHKQNSQTNPPAIYQTNKQANTTDTNQTKSTKLKTNLNQTQPVNKANNDKTITITNRKIRQILNHKQTNRTATNNTY